MDDLKLAERELKDVVNLLEDSFKVYILVGDCSYAPTGEPFIAYCSVGSKPEGIKTKTFESPLEAVDEYRRTIRDIITMGNGTLYWRERPHISRCEDGMYVVYSRFLISAKPLDADVYDKFYAKIAAEEYRKAYELYDATVGWFD